MRNSPGRLPACALLVLSLANAAAAQEGFSLFTSDFPPEEFAARRAKVYAAIENGIALIQGAPSPEGYTRFRQGNEFYYLSGIEAPHAYLLLDGMSKRAAVYLPHRQEGRERSEGKVLSAEDADEVKRLSGVDAVFGVDLLAEHLGRWTRGPKRVLWVPFQPAEGLAVSRDLAVRRVTDSFSDPWDGRGSREGALLSKLRLTFPQFELADLSPKLDELRLIKSPREMELIRKATRLAGEALLESMRSTVPGIYEYELDAVAKYVFFRNGAQGDAYYSLIASGTNAWYPHYNAGKRRMLDGDFLLMDYAPDVGYYMSDITRMWPVNGKFSAVQRELYNFYLACYRAILEEIKPGQTPAAIIGAAAKKMQPILAAAKFSKPEYERAAKEFVEGYARGASSPRASLGHWVGMATHDVGADSGPLRPGMVFTIEPALRVPEEKIYIRLEDLIIIHEDRAEIVSDYLPMDAEAIEKVMKEDGMLQKYPRK